MKTDWKALAAGIVSLAAILTLSAGTASAGWRSYAYKHGAGSYIEKYVDPHVTEDNRYKGNKHDKWSGKYYNTKTGKWTGKTYDGEWGGKTTSGQTAAGKPKKQVAAKAYVAKPAKVAPVMAPAAATVEAEQNGAAMAPTSGSGTPAGPPSELYGPPAPGDVQ
jgi:hypothetical protein